MACKKKKNSSQEMRNGSPHEERIASLSEPFNASEQNGCLFCNKHRKRVKGRLHNLIITSNQMTIDTLKSNATILNDISLVSKINDSLLAHSDIKYHKLCKVQYENHSASYTAQQQEKRKWHFKRNFHNIVYQELCAFINENVINKKKCFFLSYLKTIYLDILAKLYESSDATFEKTNFSPRHLEERLVIVSTFKRKVSVISLKQKNCQTICWSFFG